MGRATRLKDDLDGTELPEGTEPVRLAVGDTTYEILLSSDNQDKLLEAVQPFIANAKVEGPSRRMNNMRSIPQQPR